MRRNSLLLDHLVGAAQQCNRKDKAKRFRGLEIDDQFGVRGLLDRQVGGLLALENTARYRCRRGHKRRQRWLHSSSALQLLRLRAMGRSWELSSVSPARRADH